jgi:hypothetical protein
VVVGLVCVDAIRLFVDARFGWVEGRGIALSFIAGKPAPTGFEVITK